METRNFKIDNYITIPGFAIVELGLSGNELICYSLINGFTQDGETEFNGSLNYISSALNVTRQNAKRILDRLLQQGLIEKREIFFSGVKFCRYVAKRNGVIKTATGCCQNGNGGVAETATHNNKDIDNNKIDNKSENSLFPEVKKENVRRTSEQLCLFADSRFADYDTFAKEFDKPDFVNIDVAYYYECVKDWSSSGGKKKRDWIATARNFMRSDLQRGCLHTKADSGLSDDAIKYLKMMDDVE